MLDYQKVILIHGMWSTPNTLADLAKYFVALGKDVVSVRLPFHFEYPYMTPHYQNLLRQQGFEDCLNAVEPIVADCETPPLLVGHSLGGLLALKLASMHPTAGQILMSPAAPADVNPWRWCVIRTFGRNGFNIPRKALTKLSHRSIRYGIANSATDDVQRLIHALAIPESGKVTWELATARFRKNSAAHVQYNDIESPTLIVSGQQDHVTPPHIHRGIHENLTHSTLVKMTKLCHWTVSGENWFKAQKHVSAWLQAPSLEHIEFEG